MKKCLIVFAKEPEKGRVKTRLQTQLTKDECLDLYKTFVSETIKLAESIDCDKKILAYDAVGEPVYLKENAGSLGLLKQKGKDLGARMHNAFKSALNSGGSKTVIVGSDSPTLPRKYIEQAFYELNLNDIVVGPCPDGGYYLIGMKEPCKEIFQGVRWSSEYVLTDTLMNIKELKMRVSLLGAWYDIDSPEDLEQYKNDRKGA